MLYGDVKLYIEENSNEKEMEVYTAINKNNGKTEKRICRKIENTGWISNKNECEGLCSIFPIERIVVTKKWYIRRNQLLHYKHLCKCRKITVNQQEILEN